MPKLRALYKTIVELYNEVHELVPHWCTLEDVVLWAKELELIDEHEYYSLMYALEEMISI